MDCDSCKKPVGFEMYCELCGNEWVVDTEHYKQIMCCPECHSNAAVYTIEPVMDDYQLNTLLMIDQGFAKEVFF